MYVPLRLQQAVEETAQAGSPAPNTRRVLITSQIYKNSIVAQDRLGTNTRNSSWQNRRRFPHWGVKRHGEHRDHFDISSSDGGV